MPAREIRAGLIGFGLVVFFMVAYYRVPGIVAALALSLYVAMSLALFKLMPVTLTLPDQWPITVALNGLAGSLLAHYEIQMAGALLTALPPLVIYIVLGRYFIRGLLAGALKG